MEIKKDFNFVVGDIGDALAYIVSQIENEEYILEYVDYYEPYWMQGVGINVSCKTRLSIVKAGYEDLYFVSNNPCPWMKDKVSHPILCVYDPVLAADNEYYRGHDPYRKKTGNFKDEFQEDPDKELKINPFPYLHEFVSELATINYYKDLKKKEIFQLAKDFVAKKLEDKKECAPVLEKKK